MYPQLFIISAPSGAGKTSLVKAVSEKDTEIRPSVSYTTRAKRPDERHGYDYFFVTDSDFNKMITENAFFEYATVFGNHYGTARHSLAHLMEAHYDVILEIDWQGARQVKLHYPEATSIFILPPSLAVLESRLRKRAQDTEETIKQRMQQAKDEMQHCDEYDYLIINHDFDTAVSELSSLIQAARLRLRAQLLKGSEEILALFHATEISV